MPGQLNLTGANAAIQLVGNDTITEDQEFVFPDTGGTVVTDDFTGDVEIDGNVVASGDLQVGGSPRQGADEGTLIFNNGSLVIARDSDEGDLWTGYRQGSNSATSTIKANGSVNARALKIIASSGEDLVNLQTTGQNIFYRPTNSPGVAVLTGQSDVNGDQTGIFELNANGQISARKTSIESIGSERRIKENIELIDPVSAWETIKSTPYYSYNYIGTDPSDVSYGPIVDEVPAEMVVQPMVENEAGVMVARSDDEGPIRTFDNGMLQARLYTALQTALTRIEALEAELKTLKGATK